MANANAANAVPAGIKSLQDAAYQQAKAGDTTESVARYVISREPSFPDELSDEGKAELTAGYRLRYAEIRPAQVYYRVSDTLYVPAEQFKGDTDKAEKVTITVSMAIGYTTHEFGKLADTHSPQFKGIVGAVREATSTYVSNRMADLKRAVNRIKNEGKTRTRAATPSFDQRVPDALKDLQAKCTTAHQRGDATADKAKLAKAIGAFNAVWKA